MSNNETEEKQEDKEWMMIVTERPMEILAAIAEHRKKEIKNLGGAAFKIKYDIGCWLNNEEQRYYVMVSPVQNYQTIALLKLKDAVIDTSVINEERFDEIRADENVSHMLRSENPKRALEYLAKDLI